MLTFPIVDPHLHVWDIAKFRYPWLDDIPMLNRTFLLKDYDAACGPVQVEKMVFVQCECDPVQYRKEVGWVSDLARIDPRIRGIVSWAPLEKGDDVRPELEALKLNPLVKGIRRIIQFEPDLAFCLKPAFIRGVKLTAELGFTFDICIDHRHTRIAARFVEQCPEVPMVLDHIGKPGIKGKLLEPWRSEIRELSRFPNVWCKVSSLATEADHTNWTIDDLRPYVDHIFDCFGFERTMFAGDWPVSSMAADYPTCVGTLEQLVQGCSAVERHNLFHDNAERFYHV